MPAFCVLATVITLAQSESFDVVSIKPSPRDARGGGFGSGPGGRWTMSNMVIGGLIRSAYDTPVSELIGAPAWVESDPYDVQAKASGDVTPAQMTTMLRQLLAERFKFAMHYETQERPVYALVVARADRRLGPGLVESKFDCEGINAARRAGRTVDVQPPGNGAPVCGMSMRASTGPLTISFGGMPLSRLVGSLGRPDGRVVIDKTGLTANYEFTLTYSTRVDANDGQPSVFTALEEQLGLKLVPDRAPLQVVVVDHIERPTPD